MKNKIPGKDLPYTTWDLFEKIRLKLIKTGDMPDNLLDYTLPTSERIPICDTEFEVKMDLKFGGNEGIYLYMYLEGRIHQNDGDTGVYHLGTFKTLVETKEAMIKMSSIGAAFIYEAGAFVNCNLSDFTWKGYSIEYYENDKKSPVGFWTMNEEKAMDRAKQYVSANANRHADIVNCTNRLRRTIRKETI